GARPLLARFAGRLHVAAINGPTDGTQSGDADAVSAVVDELAAKGDVAQLLPFPYAFRSPAMDRTRGDFLAAVAGLTPRTGEVPFVSTATGTEGDGEPL